MRPLIRSTHASMPGSSGSAQTDASLHSSCRDVPVVSELEEDQVSRLRGGYAGLGADTKTDLSQEETTCEIHRSDPRRALD